VTRLMSGSSTLYSKGVDLVAEPCFALGWAGSCGGDWTWCFIEGGRFADNACSEAAPRQNSARANFDEYVTLVTCLGRSWPARYLVPVEELV
jgi:hypothetical protein